VDRFPFGVDPGAFRRSTELAFSQAEDAFNSLSSDVAAASLEREVRLGEPAAVLAQVAADLRRRVDRGRVAGPRGMALRRPGLRVERRRAARAVPRDDRPGARSGGSGRCLTVSAVVRLHLADDAECAVPYLSRLDAEGRRNVTHSDTREQHADDREILGVESG
jgi:hypothetical protein